MKTIRFTTKNIENGELEIQIQIENNAETNKPNVEVIDGRPDNPESNLEIGTSPEGKPPRRNGGLWASEAASIEQLERLSAWWSAVGPFVQMWELAGNENDCPKGCRAFAQLAIEAARAIEAVRMPAADALTYWQELLQLDARDNFDNQDVIEFIVQALFQIQASQVNPVID